MHSFLKMTRGKPVVREIRELIVKKFNLKDSYGTISKDLKISRATVQSIEENYKEYGTTKTRVSNRGRVSKITARQTRALESIIKRDRRSSVRNLATAWSQAIGKPIGREWTRQNLRILGYGFYKVRILILVLCRFYKKYIVAFLGKGKAFSNWFTEEKTVDMGKIQEPLDSKAVGFSHIQ